MKINLKIRRGIFLLISPILFLPTQVMPADATFIYPQSDFSIYYILVLAVAGGLILNLMPCVLPVLSIKILSLIKHGEYDALTRKLHGLVYTAGVVISFLVVAGLLLGLRASGKMAGWGFQLQAPWFIATLIYLFYVMGLGLSGFIELGASLARIANIFKYHSGLMGSFLNGVLAMVVATPCTVPFMGTAMGYALSHSTLIALLVFTALGLGLALPFLLIAFIPALARLLPKPGRWMETLKQFFAFPLYLTSVWLLWVLSRLTGDDSIILILIGLVMITFSLWLWRLNTYGNKLFFIRSVALFFLLAAVLVLPAPGETEIQRPVSSKATANGHTVLPYSEERLESFLAGNRIVFVNLTADWCITCKVNELIAINDARVVATFNEKDVVHLKGDWTNGDETISRVLERFGRSGVPLYLLYQPGRAKPRILPQLLTPEILIQALESPKA